jgi:CheY-like chemotaxis protein
MHAVLVVDDDDDVRQTLRMTLCEAGYQVLCARDGGEALEIMERLITPCLVLLDLIMPGMNGWEFRERQLANPRLAAFPVVVMAPALTLEAAAIDAIALLPKPLELDSLLEMVERCAPADRPEETSCNPLGTPLALDERGPRSA